MLPEDLCAEFEKAHAAYEPFDPKVRWAKFKTLHLTLHFFASCEGEKVILLDRLTRQIAKSFQNFDLRTAGCGLFSHRGNPKVFWWGIEESKPLGELFQRLSAIYEAHGFALEKRDYQPHVTLVRFDHPPKLGTDCLENIENKWSLKGREFSARKLTLFKGPVTPLGYEILSEYSFEK